MKRLIASLIVLLFAATLSLAHDPRTVAKNLSHTLSIEGAGKLTLDDIEEAKKAVPNLVLSMCGNAKAGAEKREGHEIFPLPGVGVVPAGVVRVVELQEQGWTYIRP